MPARRENALPIDALRAVFGERLQENVRLSNYTTARVGGPAEGLLIVNSSGELAETIAHLWRLEIPFYILGSGSNILVSDAGFQGVIVINHARAVKIEDRGEAPAVWTESGANLSSVARQIALRGLSGLEWASVVPGSVGGAVYGNAGAHGGDMMGSLLLAEILHREKGRENWPTERLEYGYRTSLLKRNPGQAIILAARLKLSHSTASEVQARMETFAAARRKTQPPGASMGSMFRNPPGDYAGRLIEAAGLKGMRIGNAEVSKIHANFFVNTGQAKASDIYDLIRHTQQVVEEKFTVRLELEVELIGDWKREERNRTKETKK